MRPMASEDKRFSWSVRSVVMVALVNVMVFLGLVAVLERGTRLLVGLKWGETAYLKFGVKYPAVNFSHVGSQFYRDTGDYLVFHPMVHSSVEWAKGPVRINKFGFRGRDFALEKPQEVFRIITMGESSTFGFHVSDDNAWPYLINEKFKGRPLMVGLWR